MKLLIKIALSALAFTVVLPQIDGITFHGNFGAALILAVCFGLMLWLVELVAVGLSALFTIGSLGLALLWIVPMWLLGFWILPAIALKLVAEVFPAYLGVTGWLPAVFGGLVMLLISLVTRALPEPRKKRADRHS